MKHTILWVPGAVTAGENIDLPDYAPEIDAIISAEILGVEHSHTSFNVLNSETAGDQTTFVGVADGAGNDPPDGGADIDIAAAGGGSDFGVQSSTDAGVSATSATATKVDENTITLDANVADGDIVRLTYAPVGARPKVA